MIDLTILRAISQSRKTYDKLIELLNHSTLEPKTTAIVDDIHRYYNTFKEHTAVDIVQFKDVFKLWHKSLVPEQLRFYYKIIDHMAVPLDNTSTEFISKQLIEAQYAAQVLTLLDRYHADEEISILHELAELTAQTTATADLELDVDWINPDLEQIVKEDTVKTGLTFRHPAINKSLRPLVGGDAMIIAARPGKGKTTFLTDTATFMAPQLDNRPVLWLNNESAGERIVKRGLQSALNATMSELSKKSAAGTLTQEYADAIGNANAIRVKDIHDMWNWQVAKIIAAHKPKLLILDMIDNIKFAGLSNNAREDQRLEEMYKWARVLGVKHNCVVMATSQISVEGEGLQFPTESMLKDSKTGKQGATDTILMIGSSNAENMDNLRWLSTPKSKFDKESAPPLKLELRLDKDRGRYV